MIGQGDHGNVRMDDPVTARSAVQERRAGSDEEVALRIRRARYRAQRRGTLESCRLLGDFAAAQLDLLTMSQLADFETLLGRPDPEVDAWMLGVAKPPAELAAIIAHIRSGQG